MVNLIPAGTGMKRYRNIKINTEVEEYDDDDDLLPRMTTISTRMTFRMKQRRLQRRQKLPKQRKLQMTFPRTMQKRLQKLRRRLKSNPTENTKAAAERLTREGRFRRLFCVNKSHRLNLWVVSKITITSIARKFFMSIIIKNRKMDEREERWKWSGLHIN